MNKFLITFISFLLILSLGLTSFKVEADYRTKSFITGSTWVSKKIIKNALTSTKKREWFLDNTIKNPEFKKKAISSLEIFINNPKNSSLKDKAVTLLDQIKEENIPLL
jgi:uncharacterized membrane protein required for colicin V production